MGSEWQQLKLGEICSLITDGKHGDSTDEAGSGYFFLSVKDVFDNRLVYNNARQITEQDFLETHRRTNLEYGDILFTNTGTIGRMAIAPDDPRTQHTTFQKSVAILKPKRNLVVPHYLYYTLKFNNKRLSELAEGTTQKNLLLKDFRTFNIKIPTIPEQLAITHILGALDDKIELNRNMNQTLEEIGQIIFRYWFVHFEFPDENGQPYKSSGGEMVNSELGNIPEGWEVKKLGDVCDITMGQSPKSKFYNEEGDGLPFHQGVTNFGNRFPTDKMYCTVENKIAEHGDILLSVRAPVGRINIAKSKMVIGRGLSAIRHIYGLQSFLLYQIKNIFTKEDSMGSGTVFNAITRKDLDDLNVIVPNNKLGKEFNDIMSPIDKQIRNLNLEMDNLSKIRNSILPKLMSGKIRVNLAGVETK